MRGFESKKELVPVMVKLNNKSHGNLLVIRQGRMMQSLRDFPSGFGRYENDHHTPKAG